MRRRQGRPRTGNNVNGRDMTEAEYSHSLTAQRLREEFEAMPPKKQQETVERVQLALDSERRDIEQRRRLSPSPLACLAMQVYGITVEWVPVHAAREAVEVSHD